MLAQGILAWHESPDHHIPHRLGTHDTVVCHLALVLVVFLCQ